MIEVLYVYVPGRVQDPQRFTRALESELGMVRLPLLPKTIYVTCHDTACLDPVALLAGAVDGSQVTEFTFEASCTSFNSNLFQALSNLPVTRLCVTTPLDEVDRLPGLVAEAKHHGLETLAIDLYADLGTCSSHAWKRALQTAVDVQAGHVATYSTSEQDEQEVERFEEAEHVLGAAGYEHYELWSHALPGCRSQFQSTAWSLQYAIGLGPSAASSCGTRRWTNQSDLDAYMSALEKGDPPPRDVETLQPIDQAAEALALGTSLLDGVDPAWVEAELLRQFPRGGKNKEEFSKAWKKLLLRFQPLENEGLVEQRQGRWALTSRGRRMADHVQGTLLLG